MRGFKKLLAIILVASLIFTSNASFIFAEGNQNENKSILEPSSDNLSSDDSSFDDLDFISTSSNINSLATNSELTENDDEENSSIQEYAEEPEDDNSLSEANETSSTEASATETSEEESSDESSIETTDSTDSTDSTNASTTSTDSSENDSTNQSSIDNDSPSTPSEIVDAEESNDDADATTATESEMSNENHSVVNNGNLTPTISEINEIIVSTNSELRLNEEIFGAGEWVWWIVDDSDPDNITINYYGTEPADYSTIESSKKGKTSGSSSPAISNAYKQTIKTAIFNNTVSARTCNAWFSGYSNLSTIQGISNLNTSSVTYMQEMFKNCSQLVNIDLHDLDTSLVRNMSHMFDGCSNLTNVNVSGLITTQVTDMSYMFKGCTSLINIDISGLGNNATTSFKYMFQGCTQLSTVNINSLFSNSVININAEHLFEGCANLSSINVGSANMGNVANATYLFDGCTSLTNLDFSGSSINSLTKIDRIFRNCSSLETLNLSSFDVSNVTSLYMDNVLQGCNSLRTIILSASFASIINKTQLTGNWKKAGGTTIYEYTSGKTTIPAEAGEYVKVCKISFDSKGGNALTPIYKEYNESITTLNNPLRQGFTFAGWYNESDYSSAVTLPFVITSDKTIYAKWSGGEGATLVYWRIGKKYSSGRTLQISMYELPLLSSYDAVGSFANTADFLNDSDVPWHIYRADIRSISVSSSIVCKSIAYWFKDMTRITSITTSLTVRNTILENASHAFDGCTNLNSGSSVHISNNLKNINSIYKNCTKIKTIQFIKVSGIPNNAMDVHLENNGFKDAFVGCSSLKRISMRYFNFSDYTGDVFSFNGLTNLVKIRFKDSGNIFNQVNLNGEWWEHDSGNKYTSSNMPTNVRLIRKYETFSNTIYWYIQGNEVHVSSSLPNNTNYINGHYFNGDETSANGMLPINPPDNATIIIDNNITLKNDAAEWFFSNLASAATSIRNINLINTNNVTSMCGMLGDLAEITNVDVSSLNTQNVTDMNSMFYGCEKLVNLDLSSFNTSKVTDMGTMFAYCNSLQSVTLNSFNTSKVETMWGMFEGCTSLTTLDLSSFTTTNLENGYEYNEGGIFDMFLNCTNLRTIYVSDQFIITCDPGYVDSEEVFNECVSLVGGNGTTYNDSHIGANYARIDRAGTPGYFTQGGSGPVDPSGGGGDNSGSGDDSGSGGSTDGGTSGGSGGSNSGGGGSIASIDNQINNAMNALNIYNPTTTQVSTVKSITSNNSLNGDTSSWAKDPSTGKWKLTAINANSQSVNASNGFFQINSTITQNINNTQVNSIASSTYYFDQSGNMVTGWVQTSDNKWYFFDNIKNANEGKMVTGWRVVGNNWYYFTPDGSMLQSGMTPDGYIVGADGAYIS